MTRTVSLKNGNKKDALSAPMPRVEKAIDAVERNLKGLQADPDSWSVQEAFCIATRLAEGLLRITWADRWGRYRNASVKRFHGFLLTGIEVVKTHHVTQTMGDDESSSDDILQSLRNRTEWLETILEA